MKAWRWTVAILILAPLTHAQEPERKPILVSFDGTEAFTQVLQHLALRPLDSLDDLNVEGVKPEETLVVLFGKLDVAKTWPGEGGLEGFRNRGGAVLIASDQPSKEVLNFWNMQIEDAQVIQERQTAYQGFQACPRLRDGFAGHALFQHFVPARGLATNGPSYLSLRSRRGEFRDRLNWPVGLAEFPKNCTALPMSAADSLWYMAGADHDRRTGRAGRLLILAGQGAFFNGMMLQPDNDNMQFAWNAVDWLCKNRRRHVLFLVDGKVEEFRIPLLIPPSIPPPPIPPAALINALLQGLEEENVFNRMLFEAFGREGLLRSVLFLASLALLIYAGRRLIQSRFSVEKGVPLVFDLTQKLAPVLSPLAARQQEQAATGNYAELAQVLARQWFWQQANMDPAVWEQQHVAMPDFTLHGSWWQRWQWRRRVRLLYDLAKGPSGPIGTRAMGKIHQLMRDLTRAAADGKI